MANDNAYKKLAQLYSTMGTDMFHKHMVVAKILEDDVNIDYILPTTALFTLTMPNLLNSCALKLAFEKQDIEVFNILLQHGADFTRKNQQGSTVLHQTIDPSKYNKEKPYWAIGGAKPKNLFAQSVLDAHVNFLNSSNPLDRHGLSHFHIACMMNHAKAVEFFLKAGVFLNQAISNDSTIFPGFTPLHLAVKFGAVETLQLLLQTDVKINIKNAKGMSPLELLIKDKMDIWIELTKMVKYVWIPEVTNLQSYLDLNERLTDMILRKFDPKALVIDETTGLSRFHIACTTTDPQVLREQLKLVPDLQHSVNATSTLWPGYTPLHFAAHYKFQVFEVLLDAGAELQAVDSKGQTPFDICLQNFDLRHIEAILRRKDEWANIQFSDGRNRLLDFIVALQDHEEFEAFLKENFVDVNSRIPEDSPLYRGYTPLHLAVACCERLLERRVDDLSGIDGILTVRYVFCLGVCLGLGCDVTAKNGHGSTPVHVAFHLGCADLIRILLDQQTSADNPSDNTGVSHLHLASLTDSTSFARELPRGCDDLDAPLEIGDFVWKGSCVRNGATPLSIALSVDAFVTAEALIERGARIPVDEFERFAKMDETMVKRLLRQYPLDSEEVLRQCGSTLHLVVDKMTNNSQFRDYLVERHGLTRLHVAVLIGADIDELTDDVNARVLLESPVWPGCTALHLLNYSRQFSKVTSLLDRGASVTVKNAHEATPIHEAFDWFPFNDDMLSLLDALLRQPDVNAVDPRGISHFHIAAAVGKVDVVEGFLRNGVNVDVKIDDFSDKYCGYTALHLAVAFGRDEVVNTLLAHGAKVHCESVTGNQPMHLAAANGSAAKIESIMKSLMRAGADINAENLFGETPLEKLLKSNGATAEKVELFVKYGCQVNVVNSLSHEGSLAMALNLKDKSIYQALINGYDHNELDEFGRSAMHNIVSLKRPSWDLLESNTIEELFIPIKYYVKAIPELTGTGLDIDFQDMLDMTPLHLAAMYQNVTGIIALLKCGANINLNEMKGLPAVIASMSHAHKATPVTHLDAQILENFWMHIWKLRFFELHVSKFNLKAESKIHGRNSLKDDVTRSCHAEMQAMDKEKIGSIALRDLLCETGVVAAYPTMLYDLRSSIDKYFKTNTNRLLEEFPELSCLLLLQYRKARKRLEMAESCSAALQFLVNLEIPRLCSDTVFRFLTYDELKNLLASASFE